ncbi:TetR/AcrR family transcriptional regulator [Streptomyces sp. AJS327]|uniref:TetR/AcrR family transcriptional regulator n=1 Tax=Streptomyces sp. AJS327 TaxID=2545265 RepID=UPI0015DDE7DB|nr:TetR/AcrR family transcriptional regulator [Streptomyces sp. AJS327]MBA0052643.1 TetR/AcrR family transcriptional regulator [Streptomyces sp. AJS327]
MAAGRTDGRIERGNQTRQLILGRAVQIASLEGLERLSLGRLANELNLSKSGVFVLFGSKEELQLATVRAAIKVYLEHVVQPAREVPPGLGRVWRLCDRWLAYSRDRVFPGGCFFYSVSAEFDSRVGKVHDIVASTRNNWLSFVEQTLNEALAAGEITAAADIPQLAFEITALLEAANAESVLTDEFTSYDRAAVGIRHRLLSVATDPDTLPQVPAPSATD